MITKLSQIKYENLPSTLNDPDDRSVVSSMCTTLTSTVEVVDVPWTISETPTCKTCDPRPAIFLIIIVPSLVSTLYKVQKYKHQWMYKAT